MSHINDYMYVEQQTTLICQNKFYFIYNYYLVISKLHNRIIMKQINN